jgi:RNA polymerase sigma-70 factor (ECF subfamily)
MDIDPDSQLVKRCQAGDISAFDDIVHRHKDRIYRLVYRMLRDSDSVNDVAQDIFVRAYRRINDFQYRSSFSTWLTRVAMNHCINYLRRKKRFRFFPAGILPNANSSDEPHAVVERTEECEKVYQAINALSPNGKAVIILHYFEDHSCGEVASILDCSIGTVKSRLFHARRELKKRLEPYIESGKWEDRSSEIGGEECEMYKM